VSFNILALHAGVQKHYVSIYYPCVSGGQLTGILTCWLGAEKTSDTDSTNETVPTLDAMPSTAVAAAAAVVGTTRIRNPQLVLPLLHPQWHLSRGGQAKSTIRRCTRLPALLFQRQIRCVIRGAAAGPVVLPRLSLAN